MRPQHYRAPGTLLRPVLAALALLALTGCPAPADDDKVDEDGTEDGAADGNADGTADGSADGAADGTADGAADGGDGGTPTSAWYADTDGDGFGDPAARVDAVEPPEGHVADSTDCDDSDPDVNPEAAEVCDGIDNDCDGAVDPGTAEGATLWYADVDADSYGDPAASVAACAAPAGHVADNTDCAPTEATAFPGSAAWEHIGDGVDQDCDGLDGCEDLDCDGLPDLVFFGAYDGDDDTLTVIYFGADGYAESGRQTIPGNRVSGVAGDVNGDGFKDLVLANQRDASSFLKTVDVHLGSVSGVSLSPTVRLSAVGAVDLALNDLNSDGYPDIVVANYRQSASVAAPNSTIYWGAAGGFDEASRTDLPTAGAGRVKVADVDGDAALDIVFCNTNNGSSYSVDSRVYHQRSGAFSTAHITDLATVGCADVEVGDVNGDGYTDIVFASLTDGATYRLNSYVYPGGPAGFLPSARYGLPSYGANDVEVADFNNDGYDDVVVTAQASMVAVPAARTYLYWGGAAGTSDTRREQWGIDAVQGAKAADLNGDGYVDLVLAHSYINDSYTSTSSAIYWGTGTGFLSTATRLPTEGPTTALIGDLDDDGHPELIFPGYRNGGGYASATTPIYWGAAGAPTYAATSVTTLAQGGGTRSGLIVGDSAW